MSDDFHLDAYLARIGFTGRPKPDLATLAALHAAHTNAIPFEGMDPLLGRPVNLELPALVAKLINSRRGGYCFEQNALFKAALEAIGFAVTPLGARVRWMAPPDAPLGPKVHMLLKVDLPEGPYIADVGFGACVLDTPLEFKTGIAQRTAMGTFRLTEKDGRFWLEAMQPAGWRTAYVFDLAPQLPADYVLGNWYTSTSPFVPFTSVLVAERVGADARHKLMNLRLTTETREGAVTSERQLANADELREVLEGTFNVTPPVSVEVLFEKIRG